MVPTLLSRSHAGLFGGLMVASAAIVLLMAPATADARSRRGIIEEAEATATTSSQSWEPCPGDAARPGEPVRLCPRKSSPAARVDVDALDAPAVEVLVSRSGDRAERRNPCQFDRKKADAARSRACRKAPQRIGRLAIAILIGWYALGLTLAVVMIVRRRRERRDDDRDPRD